MNRLLLRWALLLSGLFLLPVLLMRAQPYDDGGLREFLTPPEDCPAPCFMGIRPGVTTVEEAVAILDEHPWVLWDDESLMSFRTTAQLSWEWSDAAPSWLDLENPAFIRVEKELAAGLNLRTTITRAESVLIFGRPDMYHLVRGDPELYIQPLLYYQAWYGDLGILAIATGVCSVAESFNRLSVTLLIQAEPTVFDAGLLPPMTNCR